MLSADLLLFGAAAWAAPPAVLHVGNGAEPETLDPQRAQSVASGNVLRDLYEGLTTLQADGTPGAGLARAWQVLNQGRTYLFTLRDDARWTDGSRVIASDVVAGLRRCVSPATRGSNGLLLLPIRGAEAILQGKAAAETLAVKALDAQRVQIELQTPAPQLLSVLMQPCSFPVHARDLPVQDAEGRQPTRLSNGAYRLESRQKQSVMRLRKNPFYWNAAAVRIETVDYHATEDATTQLNRYRAGELHITNDVSLREGPRLRALFGDALKVAPYLGTQYYGFNCGQVPFADVPALRAALGMVIDRQVIVDKVLYGFATPAYSLLPPDLSGIAPLTPEWARWPRKQRLAQARALYAQAGYSPGKPLKLTLRYSNHDDNTRLAIVVAAMWKQWLGVETTLVKEEAKVFLQNRRLRQLTQVFRASWIADYDDAMNFASLLRSDSPQNYSGWSDAGYDALLARAMQTPNGIVRNGLLREAEQRMQQAWPIMPIYHYVSLHLVSPAVRGWSANALDYHYSKDLWLE